MSHSRHAAPEQMRQERGCSAAGPSRTLCPAEGLGTDFLPFAPSTPMKPRGFRGASSPGPQLPVPHPTADPLLLSIPLHGTACRVLGLSKERKKKKPHRLTPTTVARPEVTCRHRAAPRARSNPSAERCEHGAHIPEAGPRSLSPPAAPLQPPTHLHRPEALRSAAELRTSGLAAAAPGSAPHGAARLSAVEAGGGEGPGRPRSSRPARRLSAGVQA